jgi:hypothetical protein
MKFILMYQRLLEILLWFYLSQLTYNTTANKLFPTDTEAANIEGREGQTHPDPNINLAPVVDNWTQSQGAYYDIHTNATDSVGIDWRHIILCRNSK